MATEVDAWAIPTPFPVGPVNAYHLPGRRPALVDAGPRTAAAHAALLEHLDQHPVRVLVVTHEHVDHSGLARTLQRDRGVEVLLHANEAETLAHWTERADARREDYVAGLRAAGLGREAARPWRYDGRPYDDLGESVRPDATFSHEERVLLGDDEFEVVDAPGHTAGSFLLSHEGTTFSGDTLLERITPNAVSVRDSERGALIRYLATLARLRTREWGLVHPGHGKPFRGAATIIDRALLHAERRQARILRELVGAPSTVLDVVHRLFPKLPEEQMFLAVSEVIGHLDVLRAGARVASRRVDGVDRFELTSQP